MLSIVYLYVYVYFVLIGLMIEPSNNYEALLTRNRKVTSIKACLSLDRYPSVVEFMSYKGVGGIKGIRYEK